MVDFVTIGLEGGNETPRSVKYRIAKAGTAPRMEPAPGRQLDGNAVKEKFPMFLDYETDILLFQQGPRGREPSKGRYLLRNN